MLALKIRGSSHKPRKAGSPRSWKGQEPLLPYVVSGGTQAFRRPGFQASGLQNCQKTFLPVSAELLAVCYLQQSQATQTSTTDGQKSHASRCSASC